VVARLRAAGMPIIGKSTTPEFGWKALTDSPLQGSRAVPGTSAIRRRLVGRRLVDDRRRRRRSTTAMTAAARSAFPAAHTGLVGLKPSFGRIAQYPADSPFADVVSQGVLARSVLDTALALNATPAPTRATGGRCRPRPRDYTVGLDDGCARLAHRPQPRFGHVNADPRCAQLVESGGAALRGTGRACRGVGR
jgi:aspartyl-tRNA(Asn)/glutamyl-tRNA(Gln) amidotransferase subunit A